MRSATNIRQVGHPTKLGTLCEPGRLAGSAATLATHVLGCLVRRVQLAVDEIGQPDVQHIKLLLRVDTTTGPYGPRGEAHVLGSPRPCPDFGLPARLHIHLHEPARHGLLLSSHAAHSAASESDLGSLLPAASPSGVPSLARTGDDPARLRHQPLAAPPLYLPVDGRFFPSVPGSLHLPDVQQGLLSAQFPADSQPLPHRREALQVPTRRMRQSLQRTEQHEAPRTGLPQL